MDDDGNHIQETATKFQQYVAFCYRAWDDLSSDQQQRLKKIYFRQLEDDNSRKLEIILEEGFSANMMFKPTEYIAFPEKPAKTVPPLRQYGSGQSELPAITISTALYSADRPTNHCLQILLQHGADVNVKSDPLYVATKMENIHAMSILLEHGAAIIGELYLDLTHKHPTPKRVDILKLLLQYGTSVNQTFYRSNTLLHISATDRYEKVDYLDILMRFGADMNSRNQAGYTPLCCAASMGNLNAFQCLLNAGAEFNTESLDKSTPLHLAFRNAMTKCVPSILNIISTDVNAINGDNCTALDYAMICGPVFNEFDRNGKFFRKIPSAKYVKLLLYHGARLNKFDLEDLKAFLTRSPFDVQLLTLLVNVYPNWKFSEFRYYPSNLKKWYPEFYQELTDLGSKPRSLKHHCRCALRFGLRNKYQATILSLTLPSTIRRYLLFDNNNDLS
uniref:Ankyrin repeat and KH domain-containing protein 1-like n=1 Tax=Saccoglossus kowalevskii TaxID=10224 RepID=A0ABM0M8E5_SACKO|nr:PREDICTED: ankyrin repeat and KH domain-containing protein 1-like [Saccoglossus kowalevskii]